MLGSFDETSAPFTGTVRLHGCADTAENAGTLPDFLKQEVNLNLTVSGDMKVIDYYV